MSDYSTIQLLCTAFVLSAIGGLASLLRSGNPLTYRAIFTAILYNGMMGLLIALVWWNYFHETNIYLLLGVSGLAGMGGVTVVDFLIRVIKKGGLHITVSPQDDHAH